MIRPATAADVERLVGLDAALFGTDAWSEDLLHGRLDATLVATQSSQIVGFVVVMVGGDVADLERIGVLRDARRCGLAHALLASAVNRVRGVDRMLLEVRADNSDALAFYAAEGFTRIDSRRGYYRGGVDALVLCRDLARPVEAPVER